MVETSEGWISLYRRFTEWEWYDSIAVKCLFVHCLLLANYKTKNWKGVTIQRGQFITSYEKLAHSNGLTIHQVRTALNKLKMTGEVAVKTTSQYSIITVKNYDLYQDDVTRKVTRMADEGQADGKQMATTNKDNKDNNDNKYILSFLNKKSDKNFKTTESNLKFIKARLVDYSTEELKRMIDYKVKEWKDDKKMNKYLRPETLFNATKCASYIEESKTKEEVKTNNGKYGNY